MNAKKWILIVAFLIVTFFIAIGVDVAYVDPYFHYHKPRTDKYYYALNASGYMNYGIAKNFDYTSMICGTSMTENFKSSEMDNLFNMRTIKVSQSGARYDSVNEIVKIALSNNADLKLVLRGIDMGFFLEDNKGIFHVREDSPRYLYDKNIWNDYRYLYDRDVVFNRVFMMQIGSLFHTTTPGIESFDKYSNWMWMIKGFGKDAIYGEEKDLGKRGDLISLTEDERAKILNNIQENVTNLCAQYPEVQFYYFFPPYSIAWWQLLMEDGTIEKQLEAERIVIEELLKHPNINLYSFNLFTDITCNLDNYADEMHYGEWINSEILKWIKNEEGKITKKNYLNYLNREKIFYMTYDYEHML